MKNCIDCGKELSKSKYTRCRSCANKGELSHFYKDGRCEDIKSYRRREYSLISSNNEIRIIQNLRVRVRDALKKNIKSINTLQLLGCSVDFLKSYLEKQFKPGMSWKNYGYDGWHIDHIKPCASFDLAIPEEQRKCFNYKNLQPLWAEENFSKAKNYGR
jgi:hypothetical protein